MKMEKRDYDRSGKLIEGEITIKPKGYGLLEGKVALITGGNLGIGQGCVLRFIQEGATVAFTDLKDGVGFANAEYIRTQGGECTYYHCDAFHEDEVKVTIAAIMEKYGRIDILVNSAGYNVATPFANANPGQYLQMVGVHGLAHCYTMWAVHPIMKAQGGGMILNFGSKSSGKPATHDPFYCFAKAGIAHMTKCISLEFARDNIRMCAIAPGAILTGMTSSDDGTPNAPFMQLANMLPRGYIGMPKDIANVVTWLCSDQADYVSGHTYYCDGGIVT